jgi:hypothetical protein
MYMVNMSSSPLSCMPVTESEPSSEVMVRTGLLVHQFESHVYSDIHHHSPISC